MYPEGGFIKPDPSLELRNNSVNFMAFTKLAPKEDDSDEIKPWRKQNCGLWGNWGEQDLIMHVAVVSKENITAG